jgi:hypothetical protein
MVTAEAIAERRAPMAYCCARETGTSGRSSKFFRQGHSDRGWLAWVRLGTVLHFHQRRILSVKKIQSLFLAHNICCFFHEY